MKEQSDMPRQTPLVELLLAVPEDARLIYEHSPTESQSIPVGPMCRQAAMELATATRERDEARAEVERLRSTLIDVVNQIRKCDPVDELGHRMTMNRACLEAETLLDSAATEAARKFCGVGELERAGYIPAGSADEREAKP